MTNSLFDAKKWNKKILLHLPKNLDELAKKTKSMQRKRSICSAANLLKILSLYACKEKEIEVYSTYEKCNITFLQVKEILCLSWSQFVNLSEERYLRYLSKKKS